MLHVLLSSLRFLAMSYPATFKPTPSRASLLSKKDQSYLPEEDGQAEFMDLKGIPP